MYKNQTHKLQGEELGDGLVKSSILITDASGASILAKLGITKALSVNSEWLW